MRLDAYIRVSRVGGRAGESFIAPEVQREAIATWARLRDVAIAEWHRDLDQSGARSARPGFQRALERVEAGDSDGIVVAKLDRFARSVPDAAVAIRRIDAAGGVLSSVAENIDPTSPFGRFAITVMLAMAELELDRIRENWNIARARAIGRGVHLRVPFGYSRGADGALIPNEHAPLVREVFRRRAAGASWGVLAAYLNEHSRTTTGAEWQTATAKHLIGVRSYTGTAHSGEHEKAGAHEAIVTEGEYLLAAKVRGVNPTHGDGALLAGLARCAACRYAAKRGKAKGRTGEIRSYRCKAQHGGGRCSLPVSIAEHRVDAYVEHAFLERLGDLGYQLTTDGGDLDAAQQRLDEQEAELDAFAGDLEARRLLGQQRYHEKLRLRVEAVEAAREGLAEATPTGPALDPSTVTALWPSLSVPEKRTILRSAIDVVFLRRVTEASRAFDVPIESRVRILWHGEGPRDLPGRGLKPVPLRPFEWHEDEPGMAGA